MRWQQELLGTFPKDEEYNDALVRWCRYYTETEEYDRRLTPHRNQRGDAEIGGPGQWAHRASNDFAREVMKRLGLWQRRTSVEIKAKRRVSGWSHEKMLEVIASIGEGGQGP